MTEIIKTILDKLNVTILLISTLISLLLYKIAELDFTTNIIILIASYLFIILVWNISLYLYKKRTNKVCRSHLLEETNENTILFYSGLSKEKKQILKQLYNLEKIDKSNELIRVVSRDNPLYNILYYQTDMFCSRLGGLSRTSIAYVVIKPEHDSLSIIFDKKFYKLIKKGKN